MNNREKIIKIKRILFDLERIKPKYRDYDKTLKEIDEVMEK